MNDVEKLIKETLKKAQKNMIVNILIAAEESIKKDFTIEENEKASNFISFFARLESAAYTELNLFEGEEILEAFLEKKRKQKEIAEHKKLMRGE